MKIKKVRKLYNMDGVCYENFHYIFCLIYIADFRWSHEAIMLLVDEYRLRESSMSSGKISHKKAWDEMSTIMNAKGHTFSGRQCMTKVNTMKRTYKTIKDHNSKSGNNNRTWKYYEVSITLINLYCTKLFPTLTICNTISSI